MVSVCRFRLHKPTETAIKLTESQQKLLVAAFCITMGLINCLIAVGVISYDPSKIHAPWWVLSLAGLVFVLGGIAILLQRNQTVGAVIGSAIVASFAAVGMWVALAGPAHQFSGGVPFLSHESNVKIARWVFGGGSVICMLMLVVGIKQILSPRHS